MTVLKFRAIDLDDRARIAEKALGHRLDQTVLPEPVGPRNSRLHIGRPRSGHSRQVGLVRLHDLLDSLVLSDDSLPQRSSSLCASRPV